MRSSAKEFVALLATLSGVMEPNKGLPAAGDRLLDAEGLAVKLWFHASALLNLSRGTRIPEVGADFFDAASAAVLARSALEAFFVFHYLFVDSQDEDENNLRYIAWSLAGLLERQTFPARSAESARVQQADSDAISGLRRSLSTNPAFLGLTPKQRRDTLKKGTWRRSSWREIGLSAGLSETHANSVYRYLCDFVHSGSLAVMQVRQARTSDIQRNLIETSLGLVMIALARMIRAYGRMFPAAQAELEERSEASELVDQWIAIGGS